MVGIGNPIAGDDGAGIEVIRRLRSKWSSNPLVLLWELQGDLFQIADRLDAAERFLFVDAAIGDRPGKLVQHSGEPSAVFGPSFHQLDICAVMRSLKALRIVHPFPPWELWGITVAVPCHLGEGLSPPVVSAVDRLCRKLSSVLPSPAQYPCAPA